MSSTYTGSASAVQTPAPAPAPGATPIITLPADNDALNAASVAQMVKVPTDYLTFIQSAVKLDVPTINSGGVGFTSVTHTGTDTGTVTPSGSVKIATGVRFMVKIIVGGSVGTATFQTSVDGGNTYGGTQTTAASMTDATSGITLAFANHFTASETYAFRSSETPQASWQDSAGNTRFAIDHVGYPMGHGRMEFREDWVGASTSVSSTSAPISNFQRWSATIATGGTITSEAADANYPGPFMALATTNSNGSQSALDTACKLVYVETFSSIVADYDVGVGTAPGGSPTWQVIHGFSTSATSWGGATSGAFFQASNANANWQCITSEGASNAQVDSGVAVSFAGQDQMASFRIEIHGSGSPYGAKVRFFISGKLVAETTTHQPAGALMFGMFVNAGAASSGITAGIGEVVIAANKALSVPGL